ncbi:hypothetical protein DPMN_084689 [Dreissena polymorpha]|uniref:Uncharacterized protein n=1 Tax=Dreissena polymorpha TaxID=45954 RepID=A0A9D3YES9_DREPO|nr:hypothetical protein DPMN_084689 [Dreissena polymorpha]
MILTYNNENGEVFHSRSCSDDVTFGLDPNKWGRYLPITKHVLKDNVTGCAWDDTDMICFKLCIGDSDEPSRKKVRGSSFKASLLHMLRRGSNKSLPELRQFPGCVRNVAAVGNELGRPCKG